LPDYSQYNIPKWEKYTKWSKNIIIWSQNRQSGRKKYQHLPLQDLAKFSQIWIFGVKYTIWQH
jgi:hypothetical protein